MSSSVVAGNALRSGLESRRVDSDRGTGEECGCAQRYEVETKSEENSGSLLGESPCCDCWCSSRLSGGLIRLVVDQRSGASLHDL